MNIPKLVTWRVKDWASCLLACKFPLDVDEDGVTSNGNKNVIFKKTKRKSPKKNKKKRSERKLSLSPPGMTRHHFHLRNNGTRSNSVSPTTSASQKRRLSWPPPPVSDEGFIVFCFDRDDGGFDVVKEEKQQKKDIEKSLEKSQKTVNRKLIYEDGGVKSDKNKTLEINGTEHDHNGNTSSPETEDLHEKNDKEVSEEMEVCSGSNGSNNSEGGRGSFAFPILGVEWMGSPVQMPKSDELSPKKPKPIALGSFQCCRFS